MKTRAEMLAMKRQLLIAECNAQRADLALQVQPFAYTLGSVGIGLRILDRIKQHPGWIAVLGAGLVAIRPRRLSGWFRIGTTALHTWRNIMPLLQADKRG